ncbi:LytTR family DNA-binding domain-containing protein [Herbaspirillum lusitanum]|uniref:LytTR family DNA-binding domain-containing protein n=1 Tax=Herbaspirillum lusitanum TaxID=213312 RepID=A0ABW9A5G6_9BURK
MSSTTTVNATQTSAPISALIAEDEALLARALSQALQRCWPQLQIAAIAENGIAAVEQALARLPHILFFDIKMPGLSGLEAAQELLNAWPDERPFPLLVFVTAYDQYALQAFDQAAVDYLLKPVNDERLMQTVLRLQARLAERTRTDAASAMEDLPDAGLAQALAQLNQLTASNKAVPRLDIIRAAVGNQVRMIPVSEVLYFEATDKYINVVTADGEALIRTSLKELIPQLDPQQFWQVHRGTVVQIRQVQAAVRDETGKLSLTLHHRKERLAVSRLFAYLFRQM